MKRLDARQSLAASAGVVTIALTAAAFWLSYEHLHDVADDNGLDGARAWAWPGTVDLFIVAGELLILRAALRARFDWFAYLLAGVGSLGSIALNVAGVGAGAEPLEYIVAAVPPVAALLAFAAVMRQVHERLAGHAETFQIGSLPVSAEPAAVLVERADQPPTIKVPVLVPDAFTDKPYKELPPALPEPAPEPESELTAIDFFARRHKVRADQIRAAVELLAVQRDMSGRALGEALGVGDRYGRRVLAAAREIWGVQS